MLIVTLLFATFVEAQSATISLKNYTTSYISKVESVKVAALAHDTAAENYKASASPATTALTSKPYFRHDTLAPYKSDNFIFENSLLQTLPWATQLTLTGNYSSGKYSLFPENEESIGYSLTIEQPLYRNTFGRELTISEMEQTAVFESETRKLESARLGACVKGSQDFLEVYAIQEKLRVYREILSLSQDVWQSTERDFSKSLVGRLSYLQAKTDWLDIQSRSLELEKTMREELRRISRYAPVDEGSILEDPSALLSSIINTPNRNEITGNLELQALTNQISAAESRTDLAREQGKPGTNLFVSAGATNAEMNHLYAYDTKEHFIMSGIKIELPIHNNTIDASVKSALNNTSTAALKKQVYEGDLNEEMSKLKEEINFYNKKLELSGLKLTTLEEQASEALKKLKASKIDFQSYILYRNQYHQERLEHFDILFALWVNHLRLKEITGMMPEYCVGVL